MARPKPDEENVVVSFRVKRSGDDWVREEAERRGMSRTDLYREIVKLGVFQLKRDPVGKR